MRYYILRTALFIISLLAGNSLFASHNIGGELTYKYRGDTVIAGSVRYAFDVTVTLYTDCTNGQPEAIAQDNPAFLTFFNGSAVPCLLDTTVYVVSSDLIPTFYSGSCGFTVPAGLPDFCRLRRKFTHTYYLPASDSGYTVAYQRCCRSASIVNITDPGDVGVSLFCHIAADSMAVHNTSAVFTNYPPPALCLNHAIVFDHSATDADGDSLTYELCPVYTAASGISIKPVTALPPPYAQVPYGPGFSDAYPISASDSIRIDATTGRLSLTPNTVGRYLIGIACKEWRAGVIINTTQRDFQWIVIDCGAVDGYQPNSGPDQTILAGDTVQFNASVGHAFSWSPATYLTDAGIANPVGHFPDLGDFSYVLHGVSDSGCTGTDTVTIHVLAHAEFRVPNAFTPNGDGKNDYIYPMLAGGHIATLKSFEIYDRQGNRVYESNYGPWDGTYKGRKMDIGAYVWQLVYVDNLGAERRQTGSVLLLR